MPQEADAQEGMAPVLKHVGEEVFIWGRHVDVQVVGEGRCGVGVIVLSCPVEILALDSALCLRDFDHHHF